MRYTLAFLLLCTTHVAHAELQAEVAKCAAIRSDAVRLICFDRIASELKVDPPRKEFISGGGKWGGQIETSPIDDSKNAFLTLTAETPIRVRHETVNPTLKLRCKEKRLEAYIVYGFFLGSDGTRVLTRFDKRPAQTSVWSFSTDGKAAFVFGSAVPFIKELLRSESLLVELTPYGESPVMTTFDVRGLLEASKALQQACPWR